MPPSTVPLTKLPLPPVSVLPDRVEAVMVVAPAAKTPPPWAWPPTLPLTVALLLLMLPLPPLRMLPDRTEAEMAAVPPSATKRPQPSASPPPSWPSTMMPLRLPLLPTSVLPDRVEAVMVVVPVE